MTTSSDDTADPGPVEYVVVGFSDGRFTGDIAAALNELLETGTIRIIDLAVVGRSGSGDVSILEIQELGPDVSAAFAGIDGTARGLLSEADLAEIAEGLAPGETAAGLLFEHVWATRFSEAVRAAGGRLLLSERIPHAIIAEARAGLRAAAPNEE